MNHHMLGPMAAVDTRKTGVHNTFRRIRYPELTLRVIYDCGRTRNDHLVKNVFVLDTKVLQSGTCTNHSEIQTVLCTDIHRT